MMRRLLHREPARLDFGQGFADFFNKIWDIGFLKMDIRRFLEETDFFRDISGLGLRSLAQVCIPKRVMRRQVLFNEGQEGYTMYVVAEGMVQLFKTASDGKEVVINTLGAGEIFGEVVLFEESRYPVGARVLEKGLVLLLPRRQIECLLESDDFRRDFIGMLMRKQRYLAERILNLSAQDVEDRFFEFLRDHFGATEEYTLTMSKKDLAAAIGTIPETLSRLILRLRKDGRIRWEGRKLTLPEGFWDDR